jgi:hypothetical protein
MRFRIRKLGWKDLSLLLAIGLAAAAFIAAWSSDPCYPFDSW